jgi:hypothetical protein
LHHSLGNTGVAKVQDLEGVKASQFNVLGQEYNSHTAAAEFVLNLIAFDACARSELH